MSVATYRLTELILYFLKLGTVGFGGPTALVGFMHRDLVERKKWISDQDYKEGIALAQLAPGPLAAQLCIYIGYVHYKLIGATLAGIAFVIPSFLMVVALGFAYVQASGLPWMQAVFYGIGGCVIGIITTSTYKLSRKSLGKDWLLWTIAILMAVVTFIAEREIVWMILLGGVIVWLKKSPPTSLKSNQLIFAPIILQVKFLSFIDDKLLQLGYFFFKAGAFVFGSGLAIVPFLYGGVVKEYHWLNEQQFLDAVAVAMITPGPVVITVGFIGFLVSGFSGACTAALATFVPCYLFTVIPAPYFKKYGQRRGIKSFVDGVTAAAIGAIIGSVFVLAKRQLSDFTSVAIALITIALLLRYQRLAEPILIIFAAIVGLLLKYFMITQLF